MIIRIKKIFVLKKSSYNHPWFKHEIYEHSELSLSFNHILLKMDLMNSIEIYSFNPLQLYHNGALIDTFVIVFNLNLYIYVCLDDQPAKDCEIK